MTVSEALNKISRAYVMGVSPFYAKLDPDPWMSAHEDLERVMLMKNPEMTEAAADRFAERCLELIAQFKRVGSPASKITVRDALAIGNEERVMAEQSVRHRDCYKCHAKDSLKLEPYGEGGMSVRVVCSKCASTAARSA